MWIGYWFDYSRKDQVDEICDAALEMVFNGLGMRSKTTLKD
jgi:hypothetical protein